MEESENRVENQGPIPATDREPVRVPSVPAAPAAAPIERPSARPSTRLAVEARQDLQAKAASTSVRAGASVGSLASLALRADPLGAYEALARAPRLADLVALTNRVVGDAARARTADWSFGAQVAIAAEEAKLAHSDAETRFGNALDVLSNGGDTEAARSLGGALWAHAVAESTRKRTEDEDQLVDDILWLATHTAFDATPLLDRALGEEAADLWNAMAGRVRQIARGRGGVLGRGEAIIACAALGASTSERAKTLCADLAKELKDPVLLRVLPTARVAAPAEVRFEGELLPAPRGAFATTVLACTGLLFAIHAIRFIGRVALAYRKPAEVSMTDAGVRVKSRTEVLGRVVREREQVIVRAGLVRVIREVRFPRAAFYGGLLALAIGSWIGVRAFVDGVRAASPSLLLVGLVIVTLGIAADFVLGSVVPGSRGKVRVLFVPKSGATLCIGNVDARRADDALARTLR